MHIPTQLRQALIGAGFVGAFFGVAGALGGFAFYSEYGSRIASAPHGTLANIFHAIGTFFWIAGSILLVFGILPSVISGALSRLLHGAPNSSPKRTRDKPDAV